MGFVRWSKYFNHRDKEILKTKRRQNHGKGMWPTELIWLVVMLTKRVNYSSIFVELKWLILINALVLTQESLDYIYDISP